MNALPLVLSLPREQAVVGGGVNDVRPLPKSWGSVQPLGDDPNPATFNSGAAVPAGLYRVIWKQHVFNDGTGVAPWRDTFGNDTVTFSGGAASVQTSDLGNGAATEALGEAAARAHGVYFIHDGGTISVTGNVLNGVPDPRWELIQLE
ncbi:MAG: hypothetical protein AB1705_21510 [Verrucomicrobiota bacterium]